MRDTSSKGTRKMRNTRLLLGLLAVVTIAAAIPVVAATVSASPTAQGQIIRRSSGGTGAVFQYGEERLTTYSVTVADADDLVIPTQHPPCAVHCIVVVTPSTGVTAPVSISDGAYRGQRLTLVNSAAAKVLTLLASLTNVDFGHDGDLVVTEGQAATLVWDGTDWRTETAQPAIANRQAKVVYMTDFNFGALADELSLINGDGSGTGNTQVISVGQHGRFALTTASDDGAHSANGSSVGLDALNWTAGAGGMMAETRIQFDAVTAVALFFGFSDALASTVEAPIFMNAADIDSDADDAAGIIFDTDATTDQWTCGGVKATVDTSPVLSGTAPSAATYYTLRVEISEAGAVTCYVDGVAVGSATANAITTTTAVAPQILAHNRSAAARVVTIDYLYAEATRE